MESLEHHDTWVQCTRKCNSQFTDLYTLIYISTRNVYKKVPPMIWLLLFLYLQCIAAIACAEIPNRQWLEVIDLLQTMVVTAGNTDTLKEQALQSIGYICQDIVSIILDIQFPNLKG